MPTAKEVNEKKSNLLHNLVSNSELVDFCKVHFEMKKAKCFYRGVDLEKIKTIRMSSFLEKLKQKK